MIRGLIDVNVLVSAILTPKGTVRAVFDAWQAGRFQHVSSPAIASRVASKLAHPKIGGMYHVTSADVAAVQALILSASDLVSPDPTDTQPVTGDPEDDEVLATAVAGNADYVVTGDAGFLRIGSYRDTAVATPGQFLSILEGGGQQ